MSRPLVVVNAPTLLDGMAELLHAADVEYWLTREDHVRLMLELLHTSTTHDLVATPTGVVPL